jgi:lipopolysaccharide export system protein LptA
MLDGRALARESAAEPKTTSPPGGFLSDFSLGSSDQPIVVDADELEFDYEQRRLEYRGKVHVTQGEMTLDCAKLIVSYEEAEGTGEARLREVIAEGAVEITQAGRRATGNRAVFDQTSRQIVLLGDPVLRDGANEVRGERLTVYLDEGRSIVEASPRKRVSAILYPGDLDKGAPPSPPAAGTAAPPPTGKASGAAKAAP